MAVRDRLQLGKSVATVGAAEEDRELVVDQLAAEAGKDGRSDGETCPLLLAAPGREPSDATAVWSHAGQDRGATLASRVGEFLAGADFGGEEGVDGKVSES